MNKETLIPLAILQAFALFGADFTAEDIQRLLSETKTIKLNVPSLPPYPVMGVHRTKCSQCGKFMDLHYEPHFMAELVKYLNEKCKNRFLFGLDDSKICPHCGDGTLYLQIKHKIFDNKSREWVWQTDWSTVQPVCAEDILLMIATVDGDHSIIEPQPSKIFIRSSFFWNAQFIIKTEAEYQTMLDKSKVKPQDQKIKQNRSLAFQKLTENASVLRKQDIEDFLKQLKAPGQKRLNCMNRSILTRMAILPFSSWERLICPSCQKPFYVLSGTNSTTPLGDLQSIIQKLDVTPDYSSLCPCCHPDTKARLLQLKVRLSGKEYLSHVSPDDLSAVLMLTNAHIPDDISQRRNLTPFLTAVQMSRLRHILLGMEDKSHVAATPAAADEKDTK